MSDESPRKGRVEIGRRSFDARKSECSSRRIQGWDHAIADCATVWNFPSEYTEGVGERSVEVSVLKWEALGC